MRIQVDFDSVRMHGAALHQHANFYAETISRIYQIVEQLNAVWQGEDCAAFVSQLESCRPSLMQIQGVVDAYASHLEASANAYQNLQTNIASAARTL